jgi:ubiquinone/menaquinone biosynthesis C-methylase UbiE
MSTGETRSARSRGGSPSRDRTIRNYNRISSWYESVAARGERKLREAGLRSLDAREGEAILEIGFGSGHCVVELASAVGSSGRVFGIDISDRMLQVTQARAAAAGFGDRVELRCADAFSLPYPSSSFDGLFMSFTLELFDPAELEPFLVQCKRVLRAGGRMCVVAMSSLGKHGIMMKLYTWAHARFPNVVDCAPLHAERLVRSAGFCITGAAVLPFWGLSVEIVLCTKP